MDDIAIVGLSFKMPGDAMDESSFWEILERGKNLMKKWPASRVNLAAFHDTSPETINKLHSLGGYFIDDDPAGFDAPFFSVTAEEANAMDPQQRWLLETSYQAFENAGTTLEQLKGSRTGVFTASSMSNDYTRMQSKDPDTAPRTAITGTAPSMAANRLSWYFDLTGPSIHVDTACSSSMVAIVLACESLRNGHSSAALVAGCNLLLSPDTSLILSNMGFLSPDSICYSFDHRANGYARGEGIICIVLKTVSDAIRNGDVIRAVIRSTGTNQDGRTTTLTQPSPRSQEALIRNVYEKAGLDVDSTRYFEAHGTGTPLGDPIELGAVASVFGACRSDQEPLYVGSVKSNIGHLEGCSGLAGIVKSILVLEKGVIPPNALFERPNPTTDLKSYHIEIPVHSIRWPSKGLRRVSINSFGFGGTNAHVIMDDAYSYLSQRGLKANHATVPSSLDTPSRDETNTRLKTNGSASCKASLRLLVWSASDEKALTRIINRYSDFFRSSISGTHELLDRLSFTLATRRSRLTWRTFAVMDAETKIPPGFRGLPVGKANRASHTPPQIMYVFTGQGAQYISMGLELVQYSVFRKTLERADRCLSKLGCPWSIFDALRNGSQIDNPDYSQPLCTVVQIALIELLKSFGAVPRAVIGFSSGEIAAAYAVGGLSLSSACKVAYFRGKLAERLRTMSTAYPWGMMATSLSEGEVKSYLYNIGPFAGSDCIHVACISSPVTCTLSGPEEALEMLKGRLDKDGIFAQRVKTGVGYHSPNVWGIAEEYSALMGTLEPGVSDSRRAMPMVSTVTGGTVVLDLLSQPRYWVDNIVSPVRFSVAVEELLQRFDGALDFVEIGPHGTLRRALSDIVGKTHTPPRKQIHYTPALHRSRPACQMVLELVGTLFTRGHNISISAANRLPSTSGDEPIVPLVNCPIYDFSHSNKYWAESRLSRDYRLRGATQGLLGSRSSDWNPLRPTWRSVISTASLPWVNDHIVSGLPLFPATGMLAMATEAIKQSRQDDQIVSGFFVKSARFLKAVVVKDSSGEQTELSLHLHPVQRPYEKEQTWFDIQIFARSDNRWSECFQANIQIQYTKGASSQKLGGCLQNQTVGSDILHQYNEARRACTSKVDRKSFYRYFETNSVKYGEAFQLLDDISWNGDKVSTGVVKVSSSESQTTNFIHPIIIDNALHLFKVQESKGATVSTPAQVPSELFNGWLSASPWTLPHTSTVRCMTELRDKCGTNRLEVTVKALTDDGSPLCVFERLVTTALRTDDAGDTPGKKLLYGVEWRPQLSLLDRDQLHTVCDSGPIDGDETLKIQRRRKLDATLRHVLQKTWRGISEDGLEIVPGHLRKYVSWMEYHLNQDSTDSLDCIDDRDIDSALDNIEKSNPAWRIFTAVARNLESILQGKTDPLHLVFDSNLAEAVYDELFDLFDNHQLRIFLELLSHESPNLKILEVGAGTGSWTKRVLGVMRDIERSTGAKVFSHYDYTDVSPAFLGKASERFAEHGARICYKTLDLERDIDSQGFACNTYDLVIAGCVLHATKDINATVRNVRKLIRPGGRLLNIEITEPEDLMANFAFGVLPGWFAATDKSRKMFPGITQSAWDRLLSHSGFSGLDLVLRDYQNDVCHNHSLMVSTAKAEATASTEDRVTVVIVVSPNSTRQTEIADYFTEAVSKQNKYEVHTCTLGEVSKLGLASTVTIISLLELGGSFLVDMSDEDFQSLQGMIQKTQNLYWVTSTNRADPEYPAFSPAQGFLRSVRTEEIDKRIVTLAVVTKEDSAPVGKPLLEVFRASFEQGSPEVDYVVRDDLILTARLKQEVSLSDTVQRLTSLQFRDEAWASGPPVKLAVTPGLLDSLHFVEDVRPVELGPTEVEVESKAWGLNFRDVFLALGRLEGDDMGSDCSGIIARVGSACKLVKPGDRVCLGTIGCMRSLCRADEQDVYQIPETLSYHTAASILTPGITAYHSLVHLGRLQKGEKILIHSASGATGQMAIWVAKMLGAEVFATVGFEAKKKHLIDNFGIPSSRIFYSRDTSFARGIRSATNGYGVDVVLNSLSGDALQASWELVAPYGRFIEMGKADINAGSPLSMFGFARNVTFSAVDLQHVAESKPDYHRQLCRAVLDLVAGGVVHHPSPINVFPVGDIERAFRSLQSGKNLGRVVISLEPHEIVRKYLRDKLPWKFEENASYIIVGGLGGLGRAIIKWMAEKGAKNLILPSRSTPSQKASQVLSILKEKGINVLTPICDISSAASLSAALEDCAKANLPPIRGCINAAMVLHDAVFKNMTPSQWRQTIESKISTTWNLHRLLPRSLDFFILLSSLAGVYGSAAQSNYAAGNAFQDALARQLASRGERAAAFDIGWMRSIGVIANSALYQQARKFSADMEAIEAEELLALLDVHCDPSYAYSQTGGQVLLGASTPCDMLARGQSCPSTLQRPLFAGFSQPWDDKDRSKGSGEEKVETAADLFRRATSIEKRAEVVERALAARLAQALNVSPDDVDPSKFLSGYGFDSLMAVELRNWILKDFRARVAVFEIMGETTTAMVGRLVAGCTEIDLAKTADG
ncbi:hypothetical protein F4778DRAFT_734349 [Xylariomycetidae sp. FL2044]|nr:hypothetical protein F4778DRAFT_734349 [Xylariomycetidae sp. FL2044]